MQVIKLGGSLLKTGQIFDCLKHIVKSNKTTVVVCGGGEFANQIRNAQKKWHFDDIAAHEMAILAMQQTAIMCQNLHHEFAIASSMSEIKNNRFTIWSPNINELNTAKIKPSWEITSDSLAAWLAIELKAQKLVLVKLCKIDSRLTIAQLTKQLIVDLGFSEFVKTAQFDLKIMSAEDFLNV